MLSHWPNHSSPYSMYNYFQHIKCWHAWSYNPWKSETFTCMILLVEVVLKLILHETSPHYEILLQLNKNKFVTDRHQIIAEVCDGNDGGEICDASSFGLQNHTSTKLAYHPNCVHPQPRSRSSIWCIQFRRRDGVQARSQVEVHGFGTRYMTSILKTHPFCGTTFWANLCW